VSLNRLKSLRELGFIDVMWIGVGECQAG
jgi:hypothetical protein